MIGPHQIHVIARAVEALDKVLAQESLASAFGFVPGARDKLLAALDVLGDLDAAARGQYEAQGGYLGHLDCRVHPPCDLPGGPACECVGRASPEPLLHDPLHDPF